MSEESILDLFDQLCDLHLGPPKRFYRKQPLINRINAKKQLKAKLFSTLFQDLSEKKRKKPSKQNVSREAEGVLLEVFRLRKNQQNKDADQLESIFNQLYSDQNDDLKSCIRLFVALKGSGDVTSPEEDRDSRNIPQLTVPKGIEFIAPLTRKTQFYKHYPPSIFDLPPVHILTDCESNLLQAFQCDPGLGINEDLVFSNLSVSNSEDRSSSGSDLFGALVQGKTHGINVSLDIPELTSPPEFRIPEFKAFRSKSSSQLSEESGLGSGASSMSSSVISILDRPLSPDDAVWDLALTEPRCQHFTWEWIGYQPGPTERPYLTEAGAQVFDVLIQLRRKVAGIADPNTVVVINPPISVQELTQHVLRLLVGVPSWIFPLDKDLNSFSITANVHISGLTSETLTNALTPFIDAGTFFHRLTCFTRPPVFNSFYDKGHTFAAFLNGVNAFLNHYTAAVLKVPAMRTILQLSIFLQHAMDQIRYLAQLCHCQQASSSEEIHERFPKGMRLLSYLYKEAQVSTSSSHYLLILSLLQMTWSPFVLYIREWAFYGVLKDMYKEFIINVDDSCRERKDEQYWTGTFVLAEEFSEHEILPDFLHDLVADIVTCGKSINLLRTCNSQHFMCNLHNRDIPAVAITFSQSDLEAVERFSKTYLVRMQQRAASSTADRFEINARAELQRKELKLIASRVADEEIKRLQGIIDKRKAVEDKKKRKEFLRLKEQMITDKERRANNDEQTKEEDRQYIARLNREEATLTQKEIDLEKNARDELIAHYAELSEDAMHRERKALWRVRRAQLDQARAQFHAREASRWHQEFQEVTEGREILETVQVDELPNWMTKLSDLENPIVVTGEEQITLPKWAEQELPQSRFSPTDETSDGLPDWARRGSSERMLEIGEEDREMDDGSVDDAADVEEEIEKSISEFREFQKGRQASKSPRSTLQKKTHVSQESTETEARAHIDCVTGKHISAESADDMQPEKASIRMVDGMDMLLESAEVTLKPHVKASDKFHASRETESAEERTHIKCHEDTSVNKESSEERQVIPRRHRNEGSSQISSESQSEVLRIIKPSLFGHVSQLSNSDYVFPRLRQQAHQISDESQFKDFGIKPRPRIRMNFEMSSTKESDPNTSGARPRIQTRFFAHQYANLESMHVDENEIRIKRFKKRNYQGHASDSTVQRLLYGSPSRKGNMKIDLEEIPELSKVNLIPSLALNTESYEQDFTFGGDLLDIGSSVHIMDIYGSLMDFSTMSEEDLKAHNYTPLSILMSKSIAAPIRAQIRLVNDAIVNYFICDLKVEEHFAALRRYLLMADGDFAEILSDILLEKLATNPLPREILNPVFLNSILHKAIGSSIHCDDEYAQNLAWKCKYMPSVLMPNEPQSLKCLELCYKVKWPLNIILTRAAMHKYALVFGFLLQIKRVFWSLKDVWHRLKRDALINKVGNCPQFRKLQLHRQEMVHFVQTMQAYIANQVIQVTWQELQTSLSQPVAGLDQLRTLHDRYVDSAVSRCLLDKKAERVMNLIRDIFCLILKFRSQLISASWQQNEKGQTTHGNFTRMVETYQSFHAYSLFLFKVVYRLSQKGYQPHLQELLIQLNFNGFYTEAAN